MEFADKEESLAENVPLVFVEGCIRAQGPEPQSAVTGHYPNANAGNLTKNA